jgi:hypothetical protein
MQLATRAAGSLRKRHAQPDECHSAGRRLQRPPAAHGHEGGHGDGARQREPGGRVVEVPLRHDRELQQLLPRLHMRMDMLTDSF